MELSLLIQDNLNLDTTTVTMEIFSRADLLIYQNKLNEAYATLDSIIIDYQGHSLVDEALFRQYDIKIKQDKKEDASELLDQIINFFLSTYLLMMLNLHKHNYKKIILKY